MCDFAGHGAATVRRTLLCLMVALVLAVVITVLPQAMPVKGWGGTYYKLTVVSTTDGNITVAPDRTVVSTTGGKITVSPTPGCTAGFLSTTTVTLTAVPDVGYVFTQWGGDLSDSGSANPASVVMGTANKIVTATFVQSDAHYNIAVEVAAAGFGTVSLNPLPPDGGYLVSQQVTLTAAAADMDYRFSHWEGALTGNTNPASIIMNTDKAVTAVFNATMTVISEPVNTGTVDLEPAQPADGYAAGTEVKVKATAAKGYRFDHWRGDLTGSNSSITITMNSAKEITANFVKKAPFPWWLIVIGIVLLLPVLIIVRVAYVVATRRTGRA